MERTAQGVLFRISVRTPDASLVKLVKQIGGTVVNHEDFDICLVDPVVLDPIDHRHRTLFCVDKYKTACAPHFKCPVSHYPIYPHPELRTQLSQERFILFIDDLAEREFWEQVVTGIGAR